MVLLSKANQILQQQFFFLSGKPAGQIVRRAFLLYIMLFSSKNQSKLFMVSPVISLG